MNETFEDLLNRKEELHPDLIPWLEKSSFGRSLKHPLIFDILYSPQMNAILNAGYKQKKKSCEEALEKGDFSYYIWLHERPYRMQTFFELAARIPDKEYWQLLGSIWSDSENLWQYQEMLPYLLNMKKDGKENIMDEEEKQLLANLPDEITIYRGHQYINRLGYSWTLSYLKAKWFAQRFQKKRNNVSIGIINKKDVIALITGRGEFEVICNHKNVKNIKNFTQEKRPDWIKNILNQTLSEFKLKSSSYHGIWHWEKVEKNAAILSKQTKNSDPLVAKLFALLHDCKRENEDEDKEHGLKAAKYVEKLYNEGKLEITETQSKILIEACEYHEDGKISENPTIAVCWDADRLDLTRVGIIPDKQLLSTEAAKELICRI